MTNTSLPIRTDNSIVWTFSTEALCGRMSCRVAGMDWPVWVSLGSLQFPRLLPCKEFSTMNKPPTPPRLPPLYLEEYREFWPFSFAPRWSSASPTDGDPEHAVPDCFKDA